MSYASDVPTTNMKHFPKCFLINDSTVWTCCEIALRITIQFLLEITFQKKDQVGKMKKQDKLTRVRSHAPPQTQMKSRLHGWACSSSAGDTCPLLERNLGNRDESETMMGWNVTQGETSKTLSVKHPVSWLQTRLQRSTQIFLTQALYSAHRELSTTSDH